MDSSIACSRIFLGIGYFLAASLALVMTRYEGGVAFVWIACALLIAALMRQPRAQWACSIVPCAVGSMLATGLFGLGWKAAPFFALLNMVEAVVAAWLFRRSGRRDRMLGSLTTLGHFVLAAGIVAPIVAAGLAGVALWGVERPVVSGMIDVATGHALGNITFTPLALILMRRRSWRKLGLLPRRRTLESGGLLLLMVAVVAIVFLQHQLPLLFLPILPIIVIAFRSGTAPTVFALVLLALVGSAATAHGHGPIGLIDAPHADRIQFFQLYLATTVLTALPVVADLQNRARLLSQVKESEARFRLLANHSTDVLLHLEVDGRIRYASPSVRALLGRSPEDLVGRNSVELVAREHARIIVRAFREAVAAGGEIHDHEYLGLSADGSTRWFEAHARAICDEQGRVESVLSVSRDVSARKTRELRLAAEAMTDPLTGLPNRRAFTTAIERRTVDRGEQSDCIAVFDIDRFKRVNDVHGHDGGDAVLKTFADVVRRVVRESDSIARLGGEEFAVLFPATSVPQALAICDRVRTEMARTVTRVGGEEVRVTVSGGVALFGRRGAEAALKQADAALYTAKRGGRDQMALAA